MGALGTWLPDQGILLGVPDCCQVSVSRGLRVPSRTVLLRYVSSQDTVFSVDKAHRSYWPELCCAGINTRGQVKTNKQTKYRYVKKTAPSPTPYWRSKTFIANGIYLNWPGPGPRKGITKINISVGWVSSYCTGSY